jgi:hypothetical protein
MTITPGYDFTVNEVPTRAKLESMTAGMSITGIDISQIDTALVGVKQGDTSTSLPAEGWMLRNAPGQLWVQTRFGRVQLWRGCWGGMETRRFPVAGFTVVGTLPYKIGEGGNFIVPATSNTAESTIAFKLNRQVDNNSVAGAMRHLDTASSGQYLRVALWGGVGWPIEATFHNFPGHGINAATPSSNLLGAQSIPFSNASTRTLYGSLHYNWNATTGTMRTAITWTYGIAMREM